MMLPFRYSMSCPSFLNMRTSPSGSPSPPAFESGVPPSPPPHPFYAMPACLKTSAAVRLYPSGARKSTAFTIEAILGLDNCVSQQVHSSTPGDRTYRTQFSLPTSDHYDAVAPSLRSPDSTRKESKLARSRQQQSESCLETNAQKIICNGGGKSKRVRTIFTPEQLEKLEREFERQQYMVGPERLYLASALNLTEAQVKVWFQNRRIKWRKQHHEFQQARVAKYRRDSGDYEGDDGMEGDLDQDVVDSSSPGLHDQ